MGRLHTEETPLEGAGRAAESAVQAFEALPLGAAFGDPSAAALWAVEKVKAAARAVVFPHVPVTADLAAAFDFSTFAFERLRYGDQLAELHRRALEGDDPGLARLLRSRQVCDRVGVEADTASRGSEVAAVDAYERAIAEQLLGRDGFAAAAFLVTTVPALEARVRACLDRHTAHVADALEQQRREDARVADGLAAAERAARAELVAFFRGRDGQRFTVRGRLVSGRALAAAARREQARDDEGMDIGATLEELRELRAQVEAAEQVEVR